MLNLTHIEKELEAMKKYVLQQSKSNLTKGGHNFQKKLYNSLDATYKVMPNSMSLDFLMELKVKPQLLKHLTVLLDLGVERERRED